MNRTVRQLVAFGLICIAGVAINGCVTAHEAQTKIEIFDNANKHKIDDCILLTIRMESSESQGHWWVVQDEKGGHMMPTEARVCTVNTGDMIDQKGKVMVTVGPYVKGHTLGVEYWLFRPGYQPDDFLSDHLERAYEDKTALDIHLLPEDSGSSLSDEKILDGARRVLEVQNFLEPCNPDVTRLLTLVIEQVERVEKDSYKTKWRKHAKDMLPKLRDALQRFPRVAVTWQNLPDKPAEEPEPVLATPTEPPKPTPPEKPVEPQLEKPAELTQKPSVDVSLEDRTAVSDLPMAGAPKAEEDKSASEDQPASELIPVDLSDLDSPSAETQPAKAQPTEEPAASSNDNTVESDLEPIRKNP